MPRPFSHIKMRLKWIRVGIIMKFVTDLFHERIHLHSIQSDMLNIQQLRLNYSFIKQKLKAWPKLYSNRNETIKLKLVKCLVHKFHTSTQVSFVCSQVVQKVSKLQCNEACFCRLDLYIWIWSDLIRLRHEKYYSCFFPIVNEMKNIMWTLNCDCELSEFNFPLIIIVIIFPNTTAATVCFLIAKSL